MQEPKYTIKDKIVEIELEEFTKFVDYVKDLKNKLRQCLRLVKFYEDEIKEYNNKFTKDK